MATLRWGMRDTPPATDIADLQQVLSNLGYYTDAVDGYFGPRTRSAVMAFQRANSLTVDGVVGPETSAALGLSEGAEPEKPTKPVTGGGRRESLHIGINRVNAALYGGWNGALSGCENDCDTMIGIARAEGYTTLPPLKTASATSQAILDTIQAAAGRMAAGDTFMVTYAGHGGQVPNSDADVDPEADSKDETWVCYDRQLIDDELWRAWQTFAAGVNIIVISDSCHSGTIARLFMSRGTEAVAEEVDRVQAETYLLKKAYYANLAVPRPGPDEPAVAGFPRPISTEAASPAAVAVATRELVSSGASTAMSPRRYPSGSTVTSRAAPPATDGGGVVTREMPLDANNRDVAARGDLYAELQLPRKVTVRDAVQCNVVSLSGCADMQLSQESGGHGVFTTTLQRVWANNTWSGSYESLIKTMEGQMGPTQTPQLGQYGPTAAQVVASTPF
jgi:Caspase domain/Putative peptidoglycan binding domain